MLERRYTTFKLWFKSASKHLKTLYLNIMYRRIRRNAIGHYTYIFSEYSSFLKYHDVHNVDDGIILTGLKLFFLQIF